MNRLADERAAIDSLDQADRAMQNIATLEARIAVDTTRANRAITGIKARLADKLHDDETQLNVLRQRLGDFILRRKDLFADPRKRRTDFGEYGLQRVRQVEVINKEALIAAIQEAGYHDLLRVLTDVNKEGLRARLEAGWTIAGARLNDGDTAVCRVSSAIIKSALEGLADAD